MDTDFNIELLHDCVILSGSTDLKYNVLIHVSLLPSSKCLFFKCFRTCLVAILCCGAGLLFTVLSIP